MTNGNRKSDATEMDATGLLQSAARLVERAIMKLDVHETACASCGGRHFDNRTHAKAYERLANTPERLRQVAVLLRDGIEADARQAVDSTAEELGLTRRKR
jgi:hypothetical protein